MRALFNRHANPATIIAIVALVFAMTGGAFAVTSGESSHASAVAAKEKKKKSKAKVVRGPAGPRGPEGKQGTAGPAGPAGPTGAAGAKGETGPTGPEGKEGKEGKAGTNGKNGLNGKSVKVAEFTAAQGTCKEGGANFEEEGTGTKTYACNGEKGVLHPGETLPVGATETGTWAVAQPPVKFELHESVFAPISFPIPLAAAIGAEHVHIIPPEPGSGGTGAVTSGSNSITAVTGSYKVGDEISGTGIPAGTTVTAVRLAAEELEISANATASETKATLTAKVPATAACSGTPENPKAASGNVCLYEVLERSGIGSPLQAVKLLGGEALPSGFGLWLEGQNSEKIASYGTWAVTG